MLLTSLADVKLFLEKVDIAHDDLLTMIITKVSARIETYLNTTFEKIQRTKYFDAGRRYCYLPAFPIDLTAALTVLLDSAVQVKDVDYVVWENEGLIEFFFDTIYLQPKQIVVTWTGGYLTYSDLPEELQYAAVLQSAYMFRRRKDLGLSSVSMPDGSVSVNSPTDLLPDVKNILNSIRRRPTIR